MRVRKGSAKERAGNLGKSNRKNRPDSGTVNNSYEWNPGGLGAA